MKKQKKSWIFLILAIVMVVVIVITIKVFFFPKKAVAKTFTEKEYTIKLTEDFAKEKIEGATYYYESDNAIVMVINEKASELADIGIGEDSTVDDYMQAIIDNNKLPEKTKINKREDYRFISYENGDKKSEKYYFVAVTFRQGDEFWLMNFACRQTDDQKFKDQFFKWADSVKFK
jgi:hypothetical protein